MDSILDILSRHSLNLGMSLVLLVGLFVLRYMVLRALIARVQHDEVSYRARKISYYIAVAAVVFGLVVIWTPQFSSVGAFVGVTSAGLVIALTDVLKNLAGWGFIVFRRPFKIGDRIEIGPHTGDVVDIRSFRFIIREIRNWVDADQHTGRLLHIPNGILFSEPTANFYESFPYIWHEIPITVTFESEWEAAKQIVLDVVERHAADPDQVRAALEVERVSSPYLVRRESMAAAVYVKGVEHGVTVTGRLLIGEWKRREVESQVWEELLPAIAAEPSVELAYPTTRFFRADLEGSGALARSGINGPDSRGGGRH